MAKSSRKPLSYPRKLTPQSQYSIREYASLTAETIWAWNRLHSSLLELFSSLLDKNGTKKKEAYAIWHVLQSDSAQRLLLSNVAEVSLPKKSHKLKQIIWLLKSINKIAAYRNAAVHVPVIFRIVDIGLPSAIYLDYEGARKNAAERLETAGSSQKFWNAMSGDLFVLGQFALALATDGKLSIEDDTAPLLHRPRLLSPPLLAEIDRQMSPPQPTKARRRQPRASHAKPKNP